VSGVGRGVGPGVFRCPRFWKAVAGAIPVSIPVRSDISFPVSIPVRSDISFPGCRHLGVRVFRFLAQVSCQYSCAE
jgi:hypothetical protein